MKANGVVLSLAVVLLGAVGLVSASAYEEPKPADQNPQIKEKLSQYILGPGDEIVIYAIDADEISNKPVRISSAGDITLPLIGRVQASGSTVENLENILRAKLKTYIQEPQIALNVTQFRSQPVSVIGSVATSGIHQLEGRKNLVEVLSLAGGLRSDAGVRIKITRRPEWGPIPLASAVQDANGFSIAEVDYRNILDATSPEENIQILPNDVISVPRAKIVYVVGNVRKPGGYALTERDTLSVLQAVALAEGLLPETAAASSKVIRTFAGATRTEISLNLRDIMAGKKADFALLPDDILIIPNSYAKSTFRRTLDTTISMVTGMVIYRGW